MEQFPLEKQENLLSIEDESSIDSVVLDLDENKNKEKETDQQKITKIRDALITKPESKGWRVKRGSEKEWKQTSETTTESPFDRFNVWLKSFSKEKRQEKKLQKILQGELETNRRKYLRESHFLYVPGTGVEGRIGSEVGILAKGFGECSGLVFQSRDKVAVIHISPNVFRDPTNGGEIVEDTDIWGHISSALKNFIDSEKESDIRKTENKVELTKDEIARLQKIIDSGTFKSIMFSGEDNYVPHEIANNLGAHANLVGLPFIKTDIHYVGASGIGGGYAVYANPENIYCVGANGKILKDGTNLPETMYSYEER